VTATAWDEGPAVDLERDLGREERHVKPPLPRLVEPVFKHGRRQLSDPALKHELLGD
jgi:hypothetical protein